MVEAIGSDVAKVGFRIPGAPMSVETRLGLVLAQELGVVVLINGDVRRIKSLKERRSDEGLNDKPTTKVYAPNLLVIVVKAGIIVARLEGANDGARCSEGGYSN